MTSPIGLYDDLRVMDIETYIDIPGRWLIDKTSVFDLAVSLARAMQHSYKTPSDSSWESGPYASSWKGE